MLASHIDNALYQTRVEAFDPDDAYRSELKQFCITTKARLRSVIKRLNPEMQAVIPVAAQRTRLLLMALPKFSGKYSEFNNFIGFFKKLVFNNNTIETIEKYNHLISFLSDAALGTIKAFHVTEDNYIKALESLKKVYDSECLIFNKNISALFDLPKIEHPSAAALRSMIDTVSAIYGSLLSLGDDKNICNTILIHLVINKVDPMSKLKWKDQLDYATIPMWSDCETVLNLRFQNLSAEASAKLASNSSKTESKAVSKNNNRSSFFCSVASGRNNQVSSTCLFCNSEDHLILNYFAYATQSVLQRFEFAYASIAFGKDKLLPK